MNKKKIVSMALALVLAVGAGIGGTLAWLKAETGAVTNTFSFGNIDLTLTETKEEYVIVPGVEIHKDPRVTVFTPDGYKDVPSYVFLTVEEQNWPEKVTYTIDKAWTKLSEGENVWYQEVTPTADGVALNVLDGDKVLVGSDLTKAEVESSRNKGETKLIFKAYAVQKAGFDTPADAWAEAQKAPAAK